MTRILLAILELLRALFARREPPREELYEGMAGAPGRFEVCLARVLKHEGGYVDNPEDPGGATNQGITQATYDTWRVTQGLPVRPVAELTPAERDGIYRLRYWDAVRASDLPVGVDYAVFDYAVHSGPARAAKALQAAVYAQQDGKVGPRTLEAVGKYNPAAIVTSIMQERLAFLRRLPHWPTFGKGWTRRIREMGAAAQADAERGVA
jgi:lysozyme family protein